MSNILKRIIGGQDQTVREAPLTVPAARATGQRPAGTPQMRVGYAQDVGRVRDHNEDVLLALTGGLEGLEALPAFGLYIVADGMGGHNLGERASAVAARTIAREVIGRFYARLLAQPEPSAERPPLQEVMIAALEAANREVAAAAPNGGTTATAALVLADHLTIAHVGDSRAYLITADTFERLTRDHSLVERLQELGQLTAQEAAAHPQRNLLYRAIGQGEGLEVDVTNHRLPPNSRLLVCSDGLWGAISEARLLDLARNTPDVQTACERLVAAANEGGGQDNISAVLVELSVGHD